MFFYYSTPPPGKSELFALRRGPATLPDEFNNLQQTLQAARAGREGKGTSSREFGCAIKTAIIPAAAAKYIRVPRHLAPDN